MCMKKRGKYGKLRHPCGKAGGRTYGGQRPDHGFAGRLRGFARVLSRTGSVLRSRDLRRQQLRTWRNECDDRGDRLI